MDVATDVGATGADSTVPYAVELTAPADTPAALSSHDAAAVLRKLRRKANDTTTEPARATPAASAVATESTADPRIKSGDAEDTAPVDSRDGRERPDAAQDPGEKTEGIDPAAAELPSIEPPRSWTKEDKELFASLPRSLNTLMVAPPVSFPIPQFSSVSRGCMAILAATNFIGSAAKTVHPKRLMSSWLNAPSFAPRSTTTLLQSRIAKNVWRQMVAGSKCMTSVG
jgi:hypothetical protein